MQAVQAPMLRPLGVGDVLDRTFNVYKSKPLVFIALSAIWYFVLVLILVALAVVVFAGALAALSQRTQTPASFNPELIAGALVGVIAFAIVAIIAAILLFSAQSASLVHAGAQRYLGKDASIGAAFRAGLAACWRLFLAGLVVFLAIAALWLVLMVIGFVVNHFAVWALVVIAALVATFYLGAAWLVAPVIVVVEKSGPLAALGRSWKLSEGHRWRIIGIQILLIVLNIILAVLIGAIFGFGAQAEEPGVGTVLESLVNFASTIIWAPVQWIAFTVLYYDLRVRKEAFDLQLAAEALPQS